MKAVHVGLVAGKRYLWSVRDIRHLREETFCSILPDVVCAMQDSRTGEETEHAESSLLEPAK